ncbi:MAG: hypothetical protein HOV81_45410 [Kofleriaceae bacterium]|nr:hypothetical protein [Kofleriaceae bacterium]
MVPWREIEKQLAANEKRKSWPMIAVVVATALSIPAFFAGQLLMSLLLVVGGVAIGVLLRRAIAVRCPSCQRRIRMYDAGIDYVKLQSLKQCPYCGVKFDEQNGSTAPAS